MHLPTHSVSLLAVKPVRARRHGPDSDLGAGADAAWAVREEIRNDNTTTEEVAK